MSEEFLGRIFEPYSRETRFGAKKVMGTGLGMSIVRSIVTQMSGRITVKSTLGKGSVFTVSLPFEVVRGAAAPAVEEQKPMPSDGNLEGMRILLAEDNVINMEIASEILTRKGINVVPAWNGHKVAIIGAGPAGLTAAGDLAKLGYKVTVYEALHVAGGVLMYGIPEFRLPKAIVQQEIDGLKKMGVDFECNMVIGKVLTIDELMGEYGYEAVFVGSGAGLPRFMGIPGESLKGVYSANEFLTRSNLMKAYLPTSKTPIRTGKKVAVVGGGNVAMDAARSALRLGAETVYIVYRRGMAELPARKEEVEHAEEEGIIFKTLCNPVEILSDDEGFVKAITCVEMELGEPDASGRRRPIEKKGSEFTMDVDTVIMSLGTSPNPLIRSTTPGLETNKHGCIVTEGDEGKTSREGVYAGGDAVTGAATVIKAMGAGKAAAKAMDEYIQNK